MKANQNVIAVAFTVFIGVCELGCTSIPQRLNESSRFAFADVEVYPEMDLPPKNTHLGDAMLIEKIASHFPDLDKKRMPSWFNGFWSPRVQITFTMRDGTVIRVRSDYEDWNSDQQKGDFRVKNDLAADIATLFPDVDLGGK